MKKTKTKVAIDFDGTVVTHEFPKIGKDIGAVSVLKRMTDNGYILNLNTMRSGKELEEALQWFKERDIPITGINEDLGQKKWTQSPKTFAHIYIDDLALGAPLKVDLSLSEKAFIDWKAVEMKLFAEATENKMYTMVEIMQWTGKNLKEIIDWIGLNESAEKWTWTEYEQVVKDEGLKLFTPTGVFILPIGEHIMKFPDGTVYWSKYKG